MVGSDSLKLWGISNMTNLRPIQLHVRDELKAFLELDEREHFARDHQEIIDDLRKEQWIGDNKRKPNYQCFDDFAFVSELARFLDDLQLWNEEIGEIRTQYFWDKETSELPERFLCVFGFTSPITKRLDYLKSRCRTIVSGIESIDPSKAEPNEQSLTEHYVEIAKSDAAKLIQITTKTLRRRILDRTYDAHELNKNVIRINKRHLPS
jgi:hypothetical protein